MKKRIIITTIIALLCCVAQQTMAQEKPDSASQAEMMAEAMKLAQPGEEHKLLKKLAGEWNIETKMWMSPGADPMIFPGTSSNKMILGGRFLKMDFSTEAGHLTGQGVAITGFDRRNEKFTHIGFDTWGTYSVSASGTYDEKTSTITMYGEDYDPVFEGTQKYNFEIVFISESSWKFNVVFLDEMHTQGGDPFKMVEVTYTLAE